MNIKHRVERLEEHARAIRENWFDLEVWKRERAEGVSLDERERRRLAEYPEHAEDIRAEFAVIRERLGRLAAMEETSGK